MDDIFYLSSKKICLGNIKKIADEMNVQSVIISHAMDSMEVIYYDNIIMNWGYMRLDEFCEQAYIDFLVKNNISSIFCISYHPIHLRIIKPFIVEVLKQYGGWIGMDGDGFFPYYNLCNIESFTHDIEINNI